MKNILITGVSGYIGGKLACALALEDDVAAIVGVDIREPVQKPAKLTFVKMDVRDPLDALIKTHDIDVVVHLAYIIPPLHDTSLMEDVNISGTKNVLSSCAAAGVDHLLYTSSATAYGFHPDNAAPLSEESPLRGNEDLTYAKNKREIEGLIKTFSDENPNIGITVLRPCFVVGPGIDNPFSEHLRKRFVMLPRENSPMQFVHEDDLYRIMALCLKERIVGVYNVAGEGLVTLSEMIEMMDGRPVWLPHRLMRPLNSLAWFLRLHFLTRFPSPAINIFVHPWNVSPRRFIERTGFEYTCDSRAAFEDFARSQKSPKNRN